MAMGRQNWHPKTTFWSWCKSPSDHHS